MYYPFTYWDSIIPKGKIIDVELHAHTTTEKDVYGDLQMYYREKMYKDLEIAKLVIKENDEAMERRKVEIEKILKGVGFSSLRKLAIAKPLIREYFMREISGIEQKQKLKKMVKDLEEWEPPSDNWELVYE